MNENFGKLVNGELIFAPKPLIVNGVKVYTNDPVTYANNGWYAIIRTDMPDDGKSYDFYWAADDVAKTITQVWTEADETDDKPNSPSVDERVEELENSQTELAEIIASNTHDLEVIHGVIDYIIMNLL